MRFSLKPQKQHLFNETSGGRSLGVRIAYSLLKGKGNVTVTKPVISRIYIVAHTWPLCYAKTSVDGVNPP